MTINYQFGDVDAHGAMIRALAGLLEAEHQAIISDVLTASDFWGGAGSAACQGFITQLGRNFQVIYEQANAHGQKVQAAGNNMATPAVRPDVTCPNDTAADPNSSASPSHAAAAASNGLDPAPEYISTELISGGRTGKFNRPYLCRSRCVHTSSSHHDVVSAGTSTN